MEHPPEHHLQQAVELAQQAARQMKKAAKLAENAAQLWQQALALSRQEHLPLPQETVQMTIATPKNKHARPETSRPIGHTPMQNVPRLTPAPAAVEPGISAQTEHAWEDGDDWWKPRQPTPTAEDQSP